jgi:homoserine dehydrogenase
MKQINVGLLGCGTVGTGVAKLLIDSSQVIGARLGATLNLKWVADIDIETDRGIQFNEGVLTMKVC